MAKHDALLGGLCELAGTVVRDAGSELVDDTLLRGVPSQWVFECVQRVEIILKHSDKEMHTTYSTKLSEALKLLRDHPDPTATQLQNKLSFRCHGRSGYAQGAPTPEYTQCLNRRAMVVCTRHVVGLACSGMCGFKYHFANPRTLTESKDFTFLRHGI